MIKKAVIIEDNRLCRQMERELLEKAGYEVFEAANAKEGIALATKELPTLIIMDIRLPYKKTGIGAAKLLRRIKETRNTPIIFVSAYAVWEQSDEMKSITRCSYVTKPFTPEIFIQEIQRHVSS